jgi:MFS family permease
VQYADGQAFEIGALDRPFTAFDGAVSYLQPQATVQQAVAGRARWQQAPWAWPAAPRRSPAQVLGLFIAFAASVGALAAYLMRRAGRSLPAVVGGLLGACLLGVAWAVANAVAASGTSWWSGGGPMLIAAVAVTGAAAAAAFVASAYVTTVDPAERRFGVRVASTWGIACVLVTVMGALAFDLMRIGAGPPQGAGQTPASWVLPALAIGTFVTVASLIFGLLMHWIPPRPDRREDAAPT